MVQGSFDRRVVTTRRVEYRIDTPYGEPVEAKTLGVVLAQVHHELGDRVQYDNAYQVRGEDGRVIISFETEESVSADVAPNHRSTAVSNGAEIHVVVTDEHGRVHSLPGTVVYRSFQGIRRPTVEVPLSELADLPLQARGTSNPAEAATSTACASMWISEAGTLYRCAMTVAHDRHQAPDDPEDPLAVWWDKQAVPVPWPNDQEPPPCVKVLRNRKASATEEPWLCRTQTGWVWVHDPDAVVSTGVPRSWIGAIGPSDELVVTMRTAMVNP